MNELLEQLKKDYYNIDCIIIKRTSVYDKLSNEDKFCESGYAYKTKTEYLYDAYNNILSAINNLKRYLP